MTDMIERAAAIDLILQLSRAVTHTGEKFPVLAATEGLRALPAQPAQGEAVAWRCKDYADGWIIYDDKRMADRYHRDTGCLMEPLYAHPLTPPDSAEVDTSLDLDNPNGLSDDELGSAGELDALVEVFNEWRQGRGFHYNSESCEKLSDQAEAAITALRAKGVR